MILRLSVHDTDTSRYHHVEVVAEPDSGIASLLQALPIQIGDRACYVGDQQLDREATIAQSPLVSGDTISVGALGPDPRTLPPAAVGVAQVLAGTDTGLAAWLPPGRHTLGRDANAAVCLRDPDISRVHAVVEVSPKGEASVLDEGSTNGTTVDGVQATMPVTVAPGATVEMGGDQLQWMPLTEPGITTTRSDDGRLEFHRSFAPTPALPQPTVTFPAKDESTRNIATLLTSALVPLIAGLAFAVLLQQPGMLLFALLTPVSMLGTHVFERRQRRKRTRAYETAKTAAEQQITTAVATEQRLRRQLAPDAVALTLAATGHRSGLWPHNTDSPYGLVLRVGTTDQPVAVDFRGDPWQGFEHPTVRGIPATVDLRSTGVLGLVGPPEPVNALLRWLVVQLGTLRSPDDLRLVVITADDDAEPAWASWLPHLQADPVPCWIGNTRTTRTARIAELKDLIATRTEQQRNHSTTRFAEDIIVVLHSALALRHLPGMREILREGPTVGVFVLCADRHAMNECRGLCELTSSSLRLTRTPEAATETVRAEGLDMTSSEQIARALAPMRDRLTLATAQHTIPYPVRYLDLVGIHRPSGDDVLERWNSQDGPHTQVILGADASGPVTVDLAVQGPHTMLGGATGAGKSILLQTLVTALLLANSPDELNLVLVDFKGGSAFLPFQQCPHVVALIRSTGQTPADTFDEAAAHRVLASVRAEVRRRESLLAPYGGEIDHYGQARRNDPDLPALPRLVMIFDEFARVLESSPDFLSELVNVAAKGRSLGMHLVLATQSLQGKTSPEMKNNIDLRITLRQNEPADSLEILDVPDAAAIPGHLRGRGMILCTKDETRTPDVFQSGYLGNPPPTGTAVPARVRVLEWPALGEARPADEPEVADAITDQDLAVHAVEDAARRLGQPGPFRPLLPPLPANLPSEELLERCTRTPDASVVLCGLADDPVHQTQTATGVDLAGTDRLLIAGGPQSGRTTLARALVHSLADRLRPEQAHLYIIEQHPGGLDRAAALPHCGGVFSPTEPDRIRRFVTWLDHEVQDRKTTRAPAHRPWILVLIDGWEYFDDRNDPNFEETALLPTLREIITSGPPQGIHIVPLGGQGMLTGKLPTLYSQRLLLPFPTDDTRRQHLTATMTAPPVLPGRAINAATGHHVQTCNPPHWPNTPRDTRDTGAGLTAPPREFPSLPTSITLDELSTMESPPSPTWIPLGIGGPAVTPVGVDLFDSDSPLLLISGPAESGRTTAAAALGHSLRRANVGVLALCPPRSPLPQLLPNDPGIRIITGTNLKDVDLRDAAAAFSTNPYVVLLDDCEQITVAASEEDFTDIPTLLEDITAPDAHGHQALILCGDATPILTGQRRSLNRVVDQTITAGNRILLTPTDRATAREHGFALDSDQYFDLPPGRGYLTHGRTLTLMHFATSASASVLGTPDSAHQRPDPE